MLEGKGLEEMKAREVGSLTYTDIKNSEEETRWLFSDLSLASSHSSFEVDLLHTSSVDTLSVTI